MEHQIFQKISNYEGAGFFIELFNEAPKSFLDSCTIEKVPENTRFATAGENVEKVWFLLSGEVKVLEEYTTGEIYVFTRSGNSEFFGEIEVVAGMKTFSTSLITAADCVFINFPASIYLQFLKNHGEILFKRSRTIVKNIFSEVKVNRAFLLISAIDRIRLYLVKQYGNNNADNKCVLKITRQQIADETGLSIKTVNRIIKKLNEQNLIDVLGHKLSINKDQYKCMLKDIDEKVN